MRNETNGMRLAPSLPTFASPLPTGETQGSYGNGMGGYAPAANAPAYAAAPAVSAYAAAPTANAPAPTFAREDESSYWATAKWNAADLQALQASQARQTAQGTRQGKQSRREERSRQGGPPPQDAPSIPRQGKRSRKSEPPPSSEAAPRQGKHSRKSATPPPTVAEIIHQRRARIDQRRTMRSFFLKLIVIAAMGYALCTYVFGFAAMKGEQMYPRIRDGDLMLYYRLEDSFSIGDVVTFVRDNTRYTGRVVAKGGDTVSMDEVGQLSVNGNIQTEEIFYPTTVSEGGNIPFPLAVGENSLFLLCDMRTQATDSRSYGAVSIDEIDGKVITILRRRGI